MIVRDDAPLLASISTTEEASKDTLSTTGITPWLGQLDDPLDPRFATCRASEIPDTYITKASHCLGNITQDAAQQPSAATDEQQGQTPLPNSSYADDEEITSAAPFTVSANCSATLPCVGLNPIHNLTTAGDIDSVGGNESSQEHGRNITAATASKPSVTGATSGKTRMSGVTGSAAGPVAVQEGFFNAISKRLQQVESNLTLSLRYVEEQSRHLQDALRRGKLKQESEVTFFLDGINRTVLSELHGMREQYNEIWQSTVLALESQADRSERDMMALSTRLNLLADEVVFQKRMAIAQAIILLSCLFLVIFSRGVPVPYLAPVPVQADASVCAAVDGSDASQQNNRRALHRSHLWDTVTQQGPQIGLIPLPFKANEELASCSPSVHSSPSSHPKAGQSEPSVSCPPRASALRDQRRASQMPALRGSESSSTYPLPCLSQPNSRKPLPSLPEHPSSSHE
ncbi:hypothetical protein CDD83_2174 [Cordyceps sp. RAO-2017]|nr:hypothetical protein CDD83_2174 [Cordyceps sp. RAO-2017]